MLISLILSSSEQVISSGRTPKSRLNGWGEDWSKRSVRRSVYRSRYFTSFPVNEKIRKACDRINKGCLPFTPRKALCLDRCIRMENVLTIFQLLYGQIREQARWIKSCAVIGYPSGQNGAILPARDDPPRPAWKIARKPYKKSLYWPSLFGQDGWILALCFFCFFFLRVYGPRLRLGP